MRLQRLTALEVDKVKSELLELRQFITNCQEILNNHQRKLDIIIAELTDIRERFGDDRKTEINLSDDILIEDEDLIPVEDVIITITNRGYVKE